MNIVASLSLRFLHSNPLILCSMYNSETAPEPLLNDGVDIWASRTDNSSVNMSHISALSPPQLAPNRSEGQTNPDLSGNHVMDESSFTFKNVCNNHCHLFDDETH